MTMLSGNLGRRTSAGLIVLLFPAALLLAPPRATAGQVGSGSASIIGQVVDESGALMPGVTVTATSPALQMPQVTTVTDEQGEYRLTPLPIGVYAVEYALSGFQTLRVEGLELSVAFVAKLDQVIKIGTLSETVTVSGVSPLIDPTSAATRTSLTAASMALIPLGRNGVASFMAQVPGVRANVDVGGSGMNDTAVFPYSGQRGSTWFLYEGVLEGSSHASNAAHIEFNSVDGARVQTSGNSAEMPRRGVLVDAVTKSGGNEFHGDAMWAQTHNRFQSKNIDDKQRAQGLTGTTRLARRWDGAAQLGGKLVKDRLWFFTGFRHRQFDRALPGAFHPDGSEVLYESSQRFQVYKLSAQLSPNNKLIGFWQAVKAHEKREATQFVPPESMVDPLGRYRTGKVEWQAVHGNSLVWSLQYGQWSQYTDFIGFAPGKPATLDIVTLRVTGDHTSDANVSHWWTRHNRGVMTLYRPDLFMGNHEFKVGFDNLLTYSSPDRHNRRSGNYQLLFSNGAPFQINALNSPVEPLSRAFYVGVYAQDAWTIGRRLTLNLGIRSSHDKGWVPEGCQEAGTFATAACFAEVKPNVWNTLAPRFHAVYDPLGTGKTVIKGGWGRFIHLREAGGYELTHLIPNGSRTTTYRWNDRNDNRDYDPGEVNLDPNGLDFVSFGNLTQGIVNPNEQTPYADEYSLAFEQQLIGDLAIRIAGLYAKNYYVNRYLNPLLPYEVYNIPIANRDPGPDGALGTADDPGTSMTYFDYPAALRGARFQTVQLVNDDPKNDTTYKTIEVAATKRLAQNWQLAGSYSATKKHIPFGDGATTPLILNPNAEINASDDTWLWIGKISGSYRFPRGILGSANYDFRSGDPLARQVLFRGGTSIPTFVMNVEPIGSLNLPAVKQLDLRAAKQFALGGGRQFEVHLDVFNALNSNAPTAINVRSGPSYLFPTAIPIPRIMQIEGRFSF